MRTKTIFKLVLLILLLPVLYIVGVLLIGTITDFQPIDKVSLDNLGKTGVKSTDSTFTAAIWNIGYGGLGAQTNFFYDTGESLRSKGMMVRSSKSLVEQYWTGIADVLKQNPVDFWLLQEVDRKSKRSYRNDQYTQIGAIFPTYEYYEATNYKVPYVPIPVLEPWKVYGAVNAGLGTYSKYEMTENYRYQLPGSFSWPSRVFQLDRCLSYHKVPLANNKNLIILNVHNSAYDDGSLKAQQLNFIKDFALEAYEKGDYVLIGGDWNQNPPGYDQARIKDKNHKVLTQTLIESNTFPNGWNWVYDPEIPTNRKCFEVYTKGSTPVTIIDFFLTSPNIEVLSVKAKDTDFAFSDHQPVLITFKLGS